MKTTFTAVLFLCSIHLFSQTLAIHPKCSSYGEDVELKQCTEEKIVKFIHDKIKYIYYYDNKTTKVNIEFDVNEAGMIESPVIEILEGEDAKKDIEKAINDLAFHTFFTPATKDKVKVIEHRKIVAILGEKDFTIEGHIKIEKKEKIQREELPIKSTPEPVSQPTAVKPTPPAPRNTVEVEEIYKVVEEMPRFYDESCEAIDSTPKEKKECADKMMLNYIYDHVKYPPIAKVNGVEGTVVIQFVVEVDGTMSNIRLVRDIGAQCGSESVRVIEYMSQERTWVAGKQRGKPVRVQFNLPIKFRLDSNGEPIKRF